ncbi:hypothetical protein AMECASPLE_022263 [Ameca splendens]|uniref:Uncharacterized protein n=1 Tax=Ameca splendens TaxID=208324 RepID=A0ABV0YF15_9TELE
MCVSSLIARLMYSSNPSGSSSSDNSSFKASSKHWKNMDFRALEFQPEAAAKVRNSMEKSFKGWPRCLNARRWQATPEGPESKSKVSLNSFMNSSYVHPN